MRNREKYIVWKYEGGKEGLILKSYFKKVEKRENDFFLLVGLCLSNFSLFVPRTLALLNEAKKTVNFKVTTGEAGGPSRLGMTAVAGSLMGLGGALAFSLAVFAMEGAVSCWKKRAKKRVHLG